MAKEVVFDLKAQISGYEKSLKQLQKAFEQIDPSSMIGKKLARVIKEAENQINDLNKHSTVHVTNDNQIERMAEKANSVVDVLQNIANLMQQVSGQDLNFDILTEETKELQKQFAEAEANLISLRDSGFEKFLSGSSDEAKNLQQTFKDLGYDIKDITSKNAGDILAKGLKEAQSEADKTEKALNRINDKLDEQKKKFQSSFGSNPFTDKSFNETAFINRVSKIQAPEMVLDPKKVFQLQQQMLEGLNNLNLNGSDKDRALTLLDGMFQNIDIGNIKSRIDTLMRTFKEQFNIAKNTTRAQLLNGSTDERLVNSLLGIDKQQLTKAKGQLHVQLARISEGLEASQISKIKTLIDKNDIEGARQATIEALRDAYQKVKQQMKQQQEQLNKLTEDQQKAQKASNAAKGKVSKIKNSQTLYTKQIQELNTRITKLQKENEDLKAQIKEAQSKQAEKVHTSSAAAAQSAETFRITAQAAQKYHQQLDQVHSKQKLIGKIEGIVQRWFSIYAAVRMVSQAYQQIKNTLKQLDDTITQIAIVTDMSQADLWAQMPTYTQMARDYAASISGVYEVSQLYYQQGKLNV